jgi:hypothetical protein
MLARYNFYKKYYLPEHPFFKGIRDSGRLTVYMMSIRYRKPFMIKELVIWSRDVLMGLMVLYSPMDRQEVERRIA